jgi:hypothetical protein
LSTLEGLSVAVNVLTRLPARCASAALTASLILSVGSGAPGSDAGRLRGLESPETGWPVKLPGRNGHEIELAPQDAVDAGTPERAKLAFEARFTRPWRSAVRLLFSVQNRQGWYYQTVKLAVVRHKPEGRWRRFEIDFTPTSADWEAVGHGRPWDELSAKGIFRAGIRLYSETPYEGELLVRGVRWESGRARAPSSRAEVVDLREPPGPVRAGELWELGFRVAGPVFDPFDPAKADFVCEVLTPEGGADRVPAFLYQEYAPSEHGEPVAVGGPEWRVRYRPRAEGRMCYRLFLGRGGEEPASPSAEGWFTVSGEAEPPEPPAEKDPPSGEFVLEVGSRDPNGSWRPELASRPAAWRGGEFRREYFPVPEHAWNVMLEWTRRWHHWQGLGVYDLGLARRFDAALAEAEQRGESLPFALLSDGPFLEHGMYRWPLNPLSRGEGGPLPGPGEFFTSDEADDLFLRRARYAIARWGHSPAISSWCVASGLPASGVDEWHVRVARVFEELDHRVTSERSVVSLHPFAVPFTKTRVLGEFERDRHAESNEGAYDGAKLTRADGRGEGGGDALEVIFPELDRRALASPGGGAKPPPKEGLPEFRWVKVKRPIDANFFDFDYMTFDVRMPDGAGGVGRAQVILRDRDLLWYECLLETPLRSGDWTRVVLDLSTAAGRLKAVGHARPWGGWASSRIREVGLRVFPNGPTPAPALVDHVKIHAVDRERPPIRIRATRAGPERVGRFGKYEIVLDLGRDFANPFDPDVVALDGIFTHEDGDELVVPGFFYEPYSRDLRPAKVVEFGRTVERDYEFLEVAGPSDWRIRFAPARTGKWKVAFRVKTPRQTVSAPGPTFRCVDSDARGFLRVAKDSRYFEHSTGQVFYPLGPVMRSPSDSRDLSRDRPIRDKILAANYRGTYQFDAYIDALSKGGGNWIRMWMCSWWCGLEWYRKWPGYGGAGWYNLQNAWRLDHVVERAEKRGVYLQLCLQNHGQTSERIDHEWEYHPYNRYEPEVFVNREGGEVDLAKSPALQRDPRHRRPAGWLENAAEFYSDPRAREMKKKLYRYIIARWGYSTNVFAWVLSSEIEFTGEYWPVQYKYDDYDIRKGWSPKGADRAANTTAYHREIARFIKEADPFKHMVTSHLSHPHRGRGVWRVPEMEYLQSNAYTTFAKFRWFHGPQDARGAVAIPFAMEQYYSRYMGRYRPLRPVILGEWGGHWMSNPVYTLDAELHSGTWSAMMTPMAGATGFWWWLHVHYRERYGVYGAVARFLEGEDRRGKGLRQLKAEFEGNAEGLHATVLGTVAESAKSHQADAYICHVQHAFSPRTAPEVKGAQFVLPGFRDGRYVVEFWDTVEGKVTGRKAAAAAGGSLKVLLPTIPTKKGDLALKVRPLK